jgi:hypothetical protein
VLLLVQTHQHHFNTSLSLRGQVVHSVVVEAVAQVDTGHRYQANRLEVGEFWKVL